jgi:ribosomal protein L40E
MSGTVVYCPACGHEIPAGAGFCRDCGHDLTARTAHACRACGAELPDGAEFCRACGSAQSVGESPYVTVGVPPVNDATPPPLDPSTPAIEGPPVEDEARSVEDAAPSLDPPPTAFEAPSFEAPVDAGGPPPPSSEPSPPRRRGLLVGSLVVLVLAAGGGAYLAFGQKDSSSDNAAKAGARADDAQVTPTTTVTDVAPTVTATPTITATATPTPTPTPDAGVLPEGPPSQFAGDIQTVLADFHQSIVSHDYRAAWNLLSARKQAKELRVDGYPKWRAAQASLAPYLDPSGLRVTVREVDRATGVALVKVTGMRWSAPNAACSEWSGFTWVKYEDGQWRYDPGFSTTPQREREWKDRYGQLLGASC